MTGHQSDPTLGFIYLGVLLLAYFLPAFVAHWRMHHQRVAITVTNLIFGWTVLGWGIALIWACTAVKHPPLSQHAAYEEAYDETPVS